MTISLKDVKNEMAKAAKAHPFLARYSVNEFGAPMLNGGSPLDLGIILVIMQELGPLANAHAMSHLLSVSPLTCKNWKKKLMEECLCEIEWVVRSNTDKSFHVYGTGIFSQCFYEGLRSYIQTLIQYWKLHYVR